MRAKFAVQVQIARALGKKVSLHRLPLDQVLLNDLFQDVRRTVAIPAAVGQDDSNRTAITDTQAPCAEAQHTAAPRELQRLESLLQVSPGLFHLLPARAFRRAFVETE